MSMQLLYVKWERELWDFWIFSVPLFVIHGNSFPRQRNSKCGLQWYRMEGSWRTRHWNSRTSPEYQQKSDATLCQSSVFWNLKYFPQTQSLRSSFIGFSRLLLDKSFFNTWQVTSSENVCTGSSPFFLNLFTSRIDFSWNLVPLYTTVSKNSLSVRYFSCEFDSWVM